ncbi:hypothetical protein PoMZ_02199 [Pyricularia oryzae]|uniref:Uncharacterized protein n=1 Tax=Pyricularia oryzae TaxID=318829 RepID=A0A4V1C5R2_PYROR|nr:hypothetical protein PoMZ_02199 [Pyricularia oryzae]
MPKRSVGEKKDKKKAHFTPTHDFGLLVLLLLRHQTTVKMRVSGQGVGHGSDLTVGADYLGSEGDGRTARVAARDHGGQCSQSAESTGCVKRKTRCIRWSKDRPGREGKVDRPTLVVGGSQAQRTNAAQRDGRGAGKRSTVPGRTVCAGKRDDVERILIQKIHTRKTRYRILPINAQTNRAHRKKETKIKDGNAGGKFTLFLVLGGMLTLS